MSATVRRARVSVVPPKALVRWSNGERSAVCEEIVADKFAARQRAQRLEQGLCPEHGSGYPVYGGIAADGRLVAVRIAFDNAALALNRFRG